MLCVQSNYSILVQTHLSLCNIANANVTFGLVFAPCVRLVNHTPAVVYAFKMSNFLSCFFVCQ